MAPKFIEALSEEEVIADLKVIKENRIGFTRRLFGSGRQGRHRLDGVVRTIPYYTRSKGDKPENEQETRIYVKSPLQRRVGRSIVREYCGFIYNSKSRRGSPQSDIHRECSGKVAGAALEKASYVTRPAEEYVNDVNVDAMWTVKAGENPESYYNLCSADPKLLKLGEDDNRIYSKFREQFPNFRIDIVDVDSLKSKEAKEKWRKFCEELKDVEDFSFGTLLRLKAREEYSEENTILVTRIQFLAIEIARNREGANDTVYKDHHYEITMK